MIMIAYYIKASLASSVQTIGCVYQVYAPSHVYSTFNVSSTKIGAIYIIYISWRHAGMSVLAAGMYSICKSVLSHSSLLAGGC